MLGEADHAQSFPVYERGVRPYNDGGHPIAFLPILSKPMREKKYELVEKVDTLIEHS